ncbi:general stress protein [uncultured Nostoc sp.]|uniref:general stress protein n=1 Tax=uncultured Nostoc sp. TaxID=340711 RepID=UPI0035CB2DE1
MNFNQVKHGIGIISTREAATQVVDELRAIDFPMQKISVFATDSEHQLHEDANANKHTITPIKGAKAGAITGGTAGGFLALTAGLGVLVIPGFGPALAVESVLATLLAGGGSAIFGSVYGAFQGWFAPEKQVRLYHPSTSPEEFLVKVEGTVDEIRQVESILRYWGVREWHVYELSKRFS